MEVLRGFFLFCPKFHIDNVKTMCLQSMNVSQITFCSCSGWDHLLLTTLVGQARGPLLSNHQRLLMAQKLFPDLKLTYGLQESHCRCLECNKIIFHIYFQDSGLKKVNCCGGNELLLTSVFYCRFEFGFGLQLNL